MENQKTIEIPQEFKRLFDTDWREAAVYGGRLGMKSHTVARYLLIRARQRKTRIACFREFQNSITESSLQLLADLIELYGLTDFVVTQNSIVNTINGSDFLFKGLHNNSQSIKSIEGIDIAWVEEAQTVSNESIEVLTPTVRKDGSQIIYTYNRLFENDPVHQRLVVEGRPNTLVINVNYDIAIKYGMMPEVIRLEMEDDKLNRPSLYRHKWLGEPFMDAEERILESDLVQNLIDRTNSQQDRVIIGVDTGHNIYYTLMNREGLFHCGYCESVAENQARENPIKNYDPYDRLEALLKRFPRSIMVADQGGDLIGIRKLQAKYPGRVFLCWFVPERRDMQIIRWGEGDEYGRVMVDRNRAIQMLVDEIKDTRFPINGSREGWKQYFEHAMNIYRVREMKGDDPDAPQYGWRYVWKRRGPDHFFLASVYSRVGMDRFSQDLAKVVTKGGYQFEKSTPSITNIEYLEGTEFTI